MRLTLKYAAITGIAGILSALSSLPAAAAEYTLQFSHVVAASTPKGKAAELMAKLVNERLGDRLKMEVYPNSQLYNDNKVMEAMRLADGKTGIMAAPSLSKFVKFSRQLQAFDLPFLFHSIDDVHKLVDSPLVDKLTGSLEQRGLKALGFWDNGMKVFSIRGDRPLLLAPDDFKGKKFRIQSSNVHAAMIEGLGGIPQKLPFKEVYTALGQGVVDGQENSWSNIYSKKFYEVQDYITVSNHAYLGYLLVVSAKFWNGLPADIRSELEQIINEVNIEERKYAADYAQQDRNRIEAAGKAKVIVPAPEQLDTWKQATAGVEKKFARKIGKPLLKEIHALLGH